MVEQVSRGQFRRALDQAGLTAPARGAPPSDLLTVQEVEVLVKRYEVKGDARASAIGEGVVNYWKLCEQVEKVRLPGGQRCVFRMSAPRVATDIKPLDQSVLTGLLSSGLISDAKHHYCLLLTDVIAGRGLTPVWFADKSTSSHTNEEPLV